MSIELSQQQGQALKAIEEWSKDKKGPQVFRLFGYAGTGKTTLAKTVAEKFDTVMFGAFTGKAAQVMKTKGCSDAQTIHSMIYDVEETESGEPIFHRKHKDEADVTDADVVCIDECSMVDDELAKDLLSFGTKILVLGDPAQLPPVKGAGYFTEAEPDFMLTEVHRQARDNPIIQMSMDIREGGNLEIGRYGESRVITRDDLTSDDVMNADQVIVGKNLTRKRYNQRMRQLKQLPDLGPVKGEKIICLRNDRQLGLLNGGLWTVNTTRRQKNMLTVSLGIASLDFPNWKERKVKVRKELFGFDSAEENLTWQDYKGTQQFTYGYALTCHKSQGSQWDSVTVFDESRTFGPEARRWAYTALTRAAKRVTWVK